MKLFGYYTFSQAIRGIWIYAVRHIADAVLQWGFWGRQFSFVLMYVVIFGTNRTADGSLVVVAPVALHEQLQQAAAASDVPMDLLEEAPEDLKYPVLILDGSVADLSTEMRVPDGDFKPEEEVQLARRLVRGLRERAVFAPTERAPVDKLALLQMVMEGLYPMAIGGLVLVGLLAGGAQARRYAADRDEGFFPVLRLGIPPAVTLFGAMLASAVIGLASSVFMVLLFAGAIALLHTLPSASMVLLAVGGMASAYGMGTLPGAVLGTMAREEPLYKRLESKSKVLVLFVPIMLITFGVIGLMPLIVNPHPQIGLLWLSLPALGPILATFDPTLSRVLFTLLCQVVVAVLCVRLTLWVISLEEGLFHGLRRQVWR